MNKKYMETLIELLKEWFENRQILQSYDFEMLKRLASISLSEQYKTTTKLQHTDEVKDNKNEKFIKATNI